MSAKPASTTSSRVVKSGQSQARAVVLHLEDLTMQARQAVLEARQDAARIIAAAKSEAEGIRQQACGQGYAEGVEQGLKQGYKDGRRQAQAEHAKNVHAKWEEMSSLVDALAGELSAANASLAEQARLNMLDFAIELAGKIVGQVAVRDIEAAKANLAKAMELADRQGQIFVKVNPNQLQRLGEYCNELASVMAPLGRVQLEGDEGVSPGGVRILSRCGEIDATIETQLANVASTLLGYTPQLPMEGMYESARAVRAGSP